MRFLYPSLFWVWAPLVLVPIVLYLFRPRPRTVKTCTLPFFKQLAREHQDTAWLKWLKHLLSLLLSILVILAAAGALARLVVAPAAESVKTVVILVDRSASMGAKLPKGTTRLEEAIKEAKGRLAGLPAGVGVVVMAYDRRPDVLLARSMDHRRSQRALGSMAVRPMAADRPAALQLARRLAALETPAAVWHLTDAVAKAQPREARPAETGKPIGEEDKTGGVTIEQICVALPKPVNVGITAFELARPPLERKRLDAFIQLHCAAEKPVEVEMEVRLDGRLIETPRITLKPGGRQKLLRSIEGSTETDRVLTLKVTAAGDVLSADDTIHARVPRLQRVRVLWISDSPDPFTELALTTLAEGDLEVLQAGHAAWPPKKPVDIVIFDGWLPKKWPTDLPVIVINPPRGLGPVRAVPLEVGLPLENLRAPLPEHPVLYGVASGRIALTQTAVVDADGLLRSLWVGSNGPVLTAGEVRGQRLAVFAFSPERSERLPLTKSYPLLIGNAIYWAAEDPLVSNRGMNRRTGELVELPGKQITWRVPDKDKPEETIVPVAGRDVELDRTGLWRTADGRQGSASLLSVEDTLLPTRPDDVTGEQAGGSATTSLLRGDLAPLLLWGVLVLLIAESWMYHRYVAY